MSIWYFSYGSNLSTKRLVDTRLKPRGCWTGRRLAGRLDEWTLRFNVQHTTWVGCGVANLVPREGAHAWGTLTEIDDKGLAVLDVFEAVADGLYRRLDIQVWCEALGETVPAVVYVGGSVPTDDSLLPSAEYMAYLLEGRDVLPAAYVKALESWPTRAVPADPTSLQK